MRIKLVALLVTLTGITSWALFHQISRKESLPEKIKFYAFYTPSDKTLPELSAIYNQYELVLEERTPEKNTLAYKVELMLQAIKENWGTIFVHTDINLQSTQPAKDLIIKSLQHTDIVVQRANSNGALDTRFIACRANKQTLQLWETIKHMMDEQPDIKDQDYLISLLQKHKIAKLKWDYISTSIVPENPIA